MPRYKITVTEIPGHPDGVTVLPEIEVFKLVIDQFEPAAKAVTAQPRRKRTPRAQKAAA